jgi:hypothetical protein
MAFRSLLLAAFVPVSIVACGGDDGGSVTPTGMHYHYVVNKATVPTSSSEARDDGLDLNGDGTVDNQLGGTLAALKSVGNFDVQATVDKAVADGSIILLADFQSKSFTSSAAAGMQVFLGTNPMPAPCNGSADTTCGHHLTGSGSFDATPNSNAPIAGKIVGGTFSGGPGNLTLQIAIGGETPILLNLIGARIKASSISETGIGDITFAGAITTDDINNMIIPAIVPQLMNTVTMDCTMLTHPPDCGCTGTGMTIISTFDKNPADCMITADELRMNSIVMSALSPDVTIDGKMAVSLGIKATAVTATYTVAGETM